MTPELLLLAGFFLFVTVAAAVTGYVFVLRPAREEEKSSHLPAGPDLPPLQARLLRTFRMMGEAFPAARLADSPVRARLTAGGFGWPTAPQVFFGIKYATGMFLAGLAGSGVAQSGKGLGAALLAALCAAGFGFLLPERALDVLLRRRAERIRRSVPSALDLLVLGLEAGQYLDYAVAECSRALRHLHPELSAELFRMHMELRASKSREDAFRNLAARTPQPDLQKLVNLLIDSDRFGAAIGPALRTHARYLRTRFRQKAQEAARKVSVKLVFPVFFCLLPAVVLVTLGPALIQLYQQMQLMVGSAP
jgi:tight adherence protein C